MVAVTMNPDRIEKQIEIQAPISRVWRAITDPKEFGEWFGMAVETPFARGQPAQGRILYPGFEHVVCRFVVQKMEPEQLFSFTWHPYDIDPKYDCSDETPTLVEFHLRSQGAGTVKMPSLVFSESRKS